MKKLIQSKRLRWIHFAPPCATFSRGRQGEGMVLERSEEQPYGLVRRGERPRAIEEANTLAIRTALLAKMAVKAGTCISIENPEESFIWNLTEFKDLLELPGMRGVCGDQCCFGHMTLTPTRWRTTAPWLGILERRCPGQPTHPPHVKMRGNTSFHGGS